MRRTRWLIAAGVVVALLCVAVIGYVAGRQGLPRASGTTSPSSPTRTQPAAASPSASASDVLGSAPTGCLGGPRRDAAMVLAAQEQAPHTPYGAVEVAAALFRWAVQFPEPTAADVHEVAPVFAESRRAIAQQQLIADYRANPNPSAGLVPDGQPFHLSTANGQWLIARGGTGDQLTVGVEATFVVNGVQSPTKSLTESFDLIWEGGAWRLHGLAEGDAGRLASGGTHFTGGCD